MNRFLSFALLVGTTIFGYVLYVQQEVGNITLSLGSFSIETSLLVFGAAFIALFSAILVLLRIYDYLHKRVSGFLFRYRQHFDEKSKQILTNSLIDIAEGRYDKAEKRLVHKINNRKHSLPLYLAAAKAAQEQNSYDRRDEYFQLAISEENNPKSEIAIGLIKAEFHLAHDQLEQALDTLTTLEALSPKHVRVLTLLSEAYRRLQRWGQLRELTDKLIKLNVLPEKLIHSLETETWHGLLKDNTTLDKAEHLQELWDEMPAHLKTSNELLEFYVCTLKNAGLDNLAAQTLQQSLSNDWQDSLIILYSGLDAATDNKQLEIAESWLKQHPDNAHLLLVLGKMCIKLDLWGKARSYYEASLFIRPMPETCLRLATLLEERLDEPEIAQDFYRKGLHLLVDNTGPAIIKNGTEQQKSKPDLKVV